MTSVQQKLPAQKFCKQEFPIVKQEICKLMCKGVISKATYTPGQFVSNIFLRPKKDGSFRLILNLKKFNKTVAYHHFKMDSLHTIIKLVTKNCFMASIDLKDAYYSIPVRQADRKFVRFKWEDELYDFTCLPNGLSCAPRKFTKNLKPPLAYLHKKGHISVAHLDDLYLQGQSYEKCVHNVIDTTVLFDQLGLVVYPEKSTLEPRQKLAILGFVIDSVSMTIQLTSDKATKLKHACTEMLKHQRPSIRSVASLIGQLVASFSGVMFGLLYYRHLDRNKVLALKQAKGNFDACMSLSLQAKSELQWWIKNVESTYNLVSHAQPQYQITTDASSLGWGQNLRVCLQEEIGHT